ncbi:hypothetical protein ACNHKD_05670 [Methylocystis sp. JAN1]|uniref:hypothetical protein n=1 Tax=Methylocystis sp. JAN1 TaxID=3397211 RepID=UPI003FA235BA
MLKDVGQPLSSYRQQPEFLLSLRMQDNMQALNVLEALGLVHVHFWSVKEVDVALLDDRSLRLALRH